MNIRMESGAWGRSSVMAALFIPLIVGLAMFYGCGEHDPATNTATSGKLVVFIDDLYQPLFEPLVDSFMTRTRAQSIDLQPMNARDAVREFLNHQIADTNRTDTSTTYALILGRRLLEDERQAVSDRGLEQNLAEVPIATDGVAVATATESALTETTRERLVKALATEGRAMSALQEDAGNGTLRFLFPSPNSSPYHYVRGTLLDGETPAGPARWLSTSDSLMDLIAAGEGVGIVNWYRAHLDSTRVRTLKVGFTDTAGMIQPPVRIHPTSLVMNLYPMEMPVVGYTLSGINSLANGFLTWVARSDIAQHYLAYQGLEPENVQMQLVPSE